MMTPAQPPAQSPWLLTWEELHNTPSQIIDGFSYEKLESYRAATADFMQQVGVALRFPQLSVSTSIVFMHRFYARKSFKEYDRFILSCTCLLLGGKVEETPKKLKDVLTEAYRVRHNCKLSEVPDADSREFWKMKEQVLVSERILLQTLGFELQIEHPYRPLLAYVKAIQATRDFAQLAWNFVNDSYRTVICLQYTYDTVAAAAVLLAAAYKGVKLTHPSQPSSPWYTTFNGVLEADVYACANTICDLYERELSKADGRQPAEAADSDGKAEEPLESRAAPKVDVDAKALHLLRGACSRDSTPGAPPDGGAAASAAKRERPAEHTSASPAAQRPRADAPRSAGVEAAPASTPPVSSAAPPNAAAKEDAAQTAGSGQAAAALQAPSAGEARRE